MGSILGNLGLSIEASQPSFWPIHFRAALRLGCLNAYMPLPSRTITGFRFADPAGRFQEADERAHYVYLNRRARRGIHDWYRDRLIAEVLQPLGVQVKIRRQLLSNRRIEVLEISKGNICILAILRNWINPLSQNELSCIKTALDKMARKLAQKYGRVWKYVIVPSVEKGQTRLEAYSDLQIYSMPYLRPLGIDDRLKQESGCDYSAAYPGGCFWPRGLVELLQGTLGRLLRVQDSASSSWMDIFLTRANTRTQRADADEDQQPKIRMKQSPHLESDSSHIVAIRLAGSMAGPRHSRLNEYMDPPMRARNFLHKQNSSLWSSPSQNARAISRTPVDLDNPSRWPL